VASEPSPAMTALKRARKGMLSCHDYWLKADFEEQKERSLFAAGLGDANSDAGTKTPSRDFDSPAPHGSLLVA
jgi:Ino eighty subunit 1